MGRSAVEIVRAYGVQAWTEGRDDWIPELCADPIVRHDAGREVRLSHAEQRARMRHNYEELRPVFEPVVLAGDDEYVTLVWNVTGRDPHWKLCGIEIFRVLDEKIVEVWNSTYMDGRWGLSRSLGARIDGGAAQALPLLRADVTVDGGRVGADLLVPVETRGIARWLAAAFGRPTSEGAAGSGRHRFAPGGTPVALSLTIADEAGPATGLDEVAVERLSFELERSGLVNAALSVSGDAVAPTAASRFTPSQPVRLADTIGSFDGDRAVVVVASIVLDRAGDASGRVTLLLDDADAVGDGMLSFGWREQGEMLLFEGSATLSPPVGAFEHGDKVQASYTWHGSGFTVLVVGEASDTVTDI